MRASIQYVQKIRGNREPAALNYLIWSLHTEMFSADRNNDRNGCPLAKLHATIRIVYRDNDMVVACLYGQNNYCKEREACGSHESSRITR